MLKKEAGSIVGLDLSEQVVPFNPGMKCIPVSMLTSIWRKTATPKNKTNKQTKKKTVFCVFVSSQPGITPPVSNPPSPQYRSAHRRTEIPDEFRVFKSAHYGRTFKMTNFNQFGLRLCKISKCEGCFGAFF